ncbi:MAG: hypothetical protein ABIP55_07960 [Tepidisphaeraceae bacterium]
MIEESASCLAEHGRVPIAFEVTERLDIEAIERGADGMGLPIRAVERAYVKNYDALPDQRPQDWARRDRASVDCAGGSVCWRAGKTVDDRRDPGRQCCGVSILFAGGIFAARD